MEDYLKLGIIIVAIYKMHYPRQLALLLDSLFRLNASSLDLHAGVACRLRRAFLYEHPQNLEHALKVLEGRDLYPGLEKAVRYLCRNSSSSRVGLRVEKGKIIWKRKCGE